MYRLYVAKRTYVALNVIVPVPFGVHVNVFASVFTQLAGFGLLAERTVIFDPALVTVNAELTFMLQFEFAPQVPVQLPALAKATPTEDELSTFAVIAKPEPEPPLPEDPEPELPLPDEPELLFPEEPLLLLELPVHAVEYNCNCTPARL